MNPDPPMKAMPERTGLLRSLLDGAARDLGRQGPRSYPNAVPGSSDPSRRRRSLGEGGPGIKRRWRAEDGTLHRRAREAGPGATLVTLCAD